MDEKTRLLLEYYHLGDMYNFKSPMDVIYYDQDGKPFTIGEQDNSYLGIDPITGKQLLKNKK